MAFMKWTPALSVNVKQFDDQHVKLVDLVNELHDAMKRGKGNEVLGSILDGLISYAATHFAEEERLMNQHAYPEAAHHRQEHAKLVDRVVAFQKKFHSGSNILLSLDVMKFLKDWFVHHIQGVDKKYGAFFNSKGIH
jgi:hemerythrin